MRVLVTGGAGYIGSHMAKLLVETGAQVTVLDDLSTGHPEAVRGRDFVKGDIADVSFMKKLLQEKAIEAVVHFAASSLVGESMADPLKYYRRNIGGTAALLQAMREAKVARIVFSSTAAVYGDPVRIPIDEMAKLDYMYVANWSLWSDIKIISRTVTHVVLRRGL